MDGGAVCTHHRYPSRALLAVPFGAIVPSDQLGPVALPLQTLHQVADVLVQILLVCLRAHLIDPVGGVFADVLPALLKQCLVEPLMAVAIGPTRRLPRLGSGLRLCQGFPVRGSCSVCLAMTSLVSSLRGRSLEDLPCSWRFSPRLPRSAWTPADPRGSHPSDPSVSASEAFNPSPSALCPRTGRSQALGSAVFPAVYVVPCVRFRWVVRRSSASFPAATLGRSGWLEPHSAGTCTLPEAPSFA
jgi:hypothetical protein